MISSGTIYLDIIIQSHTIMVNYCREELRLKSKNVMYPPGLYKGIIWEEGGNGKLLYVGVQDQFYTYTMFDVCALWAVKYIEGEMNVSDKQSRDR